MVSDLPKRSSENSIFSTLSFFQWHFSVFMIFNSVDVFWTVVQLNYPRPALTLMVLRFLRRLSDNRPDLFCLCPWFIAEIVSHAVRTHQSCHNHVSVNYSKFVKPQDVEHRKCWLCLRKLSLLPWIFPWSKIITVVPCWFLGQLWEIASVPGLKECTQQMAQW